MQPFSEDERDVAVAEFVSDQLHGLENFNDVLFRRAGCDREKGISISEITWGLDIQERNAIEDITWIHPKKIFLGQYG